LADHDDAVDLNGPDIDLERAVRTLPARQRQAVDLYYFVGLDVAGVAQVMRCAPGTVRATLHQARTALRELLGDTDE
jgi:RNA polymerase sigma-70 factor (ECF subfamily)